MQDRLRSRWYLRDRFIEISLIVIGLVVVLSLLGGFLLDWRSFLEGVLASIAFSAITIVVGLFFVDRLIEHRQEQQWEKVRLLTYRGLSAHLCDLASMIGACFPLEDTSFVEVLQGRNQPILEAVTQFTRLCEALRHLTDSKDPDRSLSDITVDFYEMERWDLEQIQSVITPRLLQSATDQKLIDALMEFDHANRTLYSAILGHKLIVTQSAYQYVPSLIAAAGNLYHEMLPHWERAEQ